MRFTETPYNLTIPTNLDLSTATSLILRYTTSKRTSGEWIPTANGFIANFQITDTTVLGSTVVYTLQLIAVIGGVTKRSNFMRLTFEKPL